MDKFKKYLFASSNDRLIHRLVIFLATIALYNILNISNNPVFSYIYGYSQNLLINETRLVYQMSILLVSFITFFSINYSISQRKKEIYIYLIHGINKRELFSYLAKLYLPDLIVAFILALPIGVVATEIINLAIIAILRLGIRDYSFVISAKGIILSLITLLIIEIFALILTSFFNDKKYPERIFLTFNIPFVVKLILGGLVGYYLIKFYPQFFHMLENILLELIIIISAILIGNYLLKHIKVKKELLLYANLRSFFKNYLSSLILYTFLSTFALIFLFDGFSEYYAFKNNTANRPDFTIFDGIEKIYDDKNLINMVSEIIPVKTSRPAIEIDKDLDSLIIKDLDYYVPYEKKPEVISYSNYKKLFPDDSDFLLESNQAIYLIFSRSNQGNMIETITEKINNEKTYVNINDVSYQISKVGISNTIFANDEVSITEIFVVSDEVFRKFRQKEVRAYNINLKETVIDEYGYTNVANQFREELFDLNVSFESLVWFLDITYADFLRSLIIYVYIFIVFTFVAISFLVVRIMSFIDKNMDNYSTLILLGENTTAISKMLQKFTTIVFFSLNIVIVAMFLFYVLANINIYESIINVYKEEGKGLFMNLFLLASVLTQFIFLKIIIKQKIGEMGGD